MAGDGGDWRADVFAFFGGFCFCFVFLANQKKPEGKFSAIGGCQESWCIGEMFALHTVWWCYDPLSEIPHKTFLEVNSRPLSSSKASSILIHLSNISLEPTREHTARTHSRIIVKPWFSHQGGGWAMQSSWAEKQTNGL